MSLALATNTYLVRPSCYDNIRGFLMFEGKLENLPGDQHFDFTFGCSFSLLSNEDGPLNLAVVIEARTEFLLPNLREGCG